MKTTILMVSAMLMLPTALVAQSSGARVDAQGQAAARTPDARLRAAFAAAAEANVPASLLESKVAEGRAKRVPEERIATAVETRLQALIRGAAALRRADIAAASEGELAVAADALVAGVSESTLVRVSRGADGDRRVVAIAVLADLVRLGQDSERAATRVSAAAASSAALANLHAEVAAQLRLGGLSSTLDVNGIIRLP